MAAPQYRFPEPSVNITHSPRPGGGDLPAHYSGALIINADDYGRDRQNTQKILECASDSGISSVSAMVFMEDSERAASIARERGIDAGLHLNLTLPFSAAGAPAGLIHHQQKIARYLNHHRLTRLVFHPGLASSFEFVVRKQIEEFVRIYGIEPGRIDGHHHMHLCANVILAKLLPAGTIVRRNFSFQPGEKSWANRSCRSFVDRILTRRHRLTGLFFSLPPLEPAVRLERIFTLARTFVVEVETHPINPAEHRFLSGGELFRLAGNLPIARGFTLSAS